MDRTCDLLCCQPDGYAGWENRQKVQPGNELRQIYGSACRQAAGMYRADLSDIYEPTECHCCSGDHCQRIIISGFRLVASDNGIVIAASYWGKFKTVSQMALIIVLIMDLGGVWNVVGTVLTWVALFLTVVSLIDYIAKNKQVLTQGGM